MWWYWY